MIDYSRNWRDYELLDASGGERLERWGEFFLIRPDPQVIWKTEKKHPAWRTAHARYHRSTAGGGHWEQYRALPESWSIGYGDLTFRLKPMGFKHTGLFPEQAVNWDRCAGYIRNAGRPVQVLNLFAYTGAATLACAAAGAAVTHVDASKGMVQWARDNAQSSGLADRPVRWLVDDCIKFVRREQRRGNTYDGIIMDPPSYGRGPGGEVWRLEELIYELVRDCVSLLGHDALFMLINSYTTGLAPSVMEYLLSAEAVTARGGHTLSYEIGLPVSQSSGVLPCGGSALWLCDSLR